MQPVPAPSPIPPSCSGRDDCKEPRAFLWGHIRVKNTTGGCESSPPPPPQPGHQEKHPWSPGPGPAARVPHAARKSSPPRCRSPAWTRSPGTAADFPLHIFGSSSAAAEQTPVQGTEPDRRSPRPGGVCTQSCTRGAQNTAHDCSLPQPAEQRALQMRMASAPGEEPPVSVILQTNPRSTEPGSHMPLPVSLLATGAPCSDNSFFFQANVQFSKSTALPCSGLPWYPPWSHRATSGVRALLFAVFTLQPRCSQPRGYLLPEPMTRQVLLLHQHECRANTERNKGKFCLGFLRASAA